MRILIVGAGFAGLTLAALLKQRGFSPVVIESQANFDNSGYMIGLYPLGSKILYGLGAGVYDAFAAHSIVGRDYTFCDDSGHELGSFLLSDLFGDRGPFLLFRRGLLLRLLLDYCKGLEIRFATSIKALNQNREIMNVTFNNDERRDFDLVVGADGMNSEVRRLIFDPKDIDRYEIRVGVVGYGGAMIPCYLAKSVLNF